MKRRSIIAALVAICASLKPKAGAQEFALLESQEADEFIGFSLRMDDSLSIRAKTRYFLSVEYNGETIKLTPEEVMAALRSK